MVTAGDTLSVRLNNALNLPLQYRCDELNNIFMEFGNKELQMVLPQLVESLFGLTDQVGWGLRTVPRNTLPREFDVLFRFLHPHGAIFRLCYRLLADYVKYEFPLAYLPVKVRSQIEDGMVPPFYIDKVQLDPQTRVPISLSLNSFEFYIFHFAYHLVNPWLQRMMDHGSWALWETVYNHLAEEYLTHFLPCDGSSVPPYAGCYVYPRSSMPLQAASRPARSPTLFRQSVVLKQSSTSSSLHSSPTLPQQSSLVEIWRSESVIQVFIDFWLSFGVREIPHVLPGIGSPPRQFFTPTGSDKIHPFPQNQMQHQSNILHYYPLSTLYMPHIFQNQMLPQPNMVLPQYPDLLPSEEHVRVVRNLVKHLHYFANSTVGDLSAMDELKRIILPSSQAKVYGFMRHTIHHWPLDSSFRLILETWLSYIQPWRYTDWRHRNVRSPGGRDNEDRARTVDRRWLNFIAENLLSYTVIFRQLLPRFTRLDLTTPKNAHMLFRVTKVFSQPNLNTMLSEVEHCLDDVPGTGLPNESVNRRNSPESNHQGHKWNALVRQQVLELEGSGYQYKPLFGSETVSQVFQFMLLIQRANESARNLQLQLERESKNHPSSFFTYLKDLFFTNPVGCDEYSLEERRKVSAYLETCLYQLSHIFEIDLTRLPRTSYTSDHDAYSSCAAPSRIGTPGLLQGENTMEMPASRSHGCASISPLLVSRDWRERRKCIKYEGDPDLQPIKSTENAFLVRLLHQITSKLNEMYTLEMCHFYEQNGLLGCIARQVLCPPIVTRTYNKSSPGECTPRVETVLPPRLSLRSFASHKTIVYMLVGIGLAWVFGYGPTTFFFFLLSLFLFYVLLKACLQSWFDSSHHSANIEAFPSPSPMNQSDIFPGH